MQARATIRVVGRTLKRGLPRINAATATVESLCEMRTGAHLLVLTERFTENHAGFGANANARPTVIHAALGGVAALMALALLSPSDHARCESIDGKETQSTYFDDDYEAKQLVGSGTFGMVMQCVSKKDGHVAAVKMIQDLHDMREEVVREKEALSSIQQAGGHDNIVRYDGSYAHDGFHYIVTEFVDGPSLFSYIQKNRQLDIASAVQFTAQLASALAFLHTRQLIHRDLKPANIMVATNSTETPTVKIIDFGSAEHFSEPAASSSKTPRAMALSGTRCYWPPEVLLRQETTPAMDMWALGCILYIMVAGRHPFDLMGSSSEDDIVQRVVSDNVSFLHPVWSSVPCSVKSLIRGLLEKDPATRLTVAEVLVHPAMHVVE